METQGRQNQGHRDRDMETDQQGCGHTKHRLRDMTQQRLGDSSGNGQMGTQRVIRQKHEMWRFRRQEMVTWDIHAQHRDLYTVPKGGAHILPSQKVTIQVPQAENGHMPTHMRR